MKKTQNKAISDILIENMAILDKVDKAFQDAFRFGLACIVGLIMYITSLALTIRGASIWMSFAVVVFGAACMWAIVTYER